MRIGIITFWWTKDNYGQILQCYALQTFLKKCGHDVFLIKYNPQPTSLIKRIKNWLYTIYIKTQQPRISNVDRKFADFIKTYIKTTSRTYYSWKDINRTPPTADYYICGSDQIWNPIDYPSNNVKPWFLCFGNINVKKISYAASFGCQELPQNIIEYLSPMLNKFKAISVREKSGIEICEKMNLYNTECVIDPTLLLDKSSYIKISNFYNYKYKKPYILGYFLNLSKTNNLQWDNILNYIKDFKINFHIVPSHNVESFIPEKNFIYPTINEWLGLYNNANGILTNSYHGTVFAIIFHKPFLVFLMKGINSRMNDRLISLLSSLELTNRIYEQNNNIKKQMELNIDWDNVDMLLSNMRNKSISFLSSNITN